MFASESNAPQKTIGPQFARTDFQSTPLPRTRTIMNASDAARAPASGQNFAVVPASLMHNRNPLNPTPASAASPRPLGRPTSPVGIAISQIAISARANPPNWSRVGKPSVRKVNATGSMAVITAATGALIPMAPIASARYSDINPTAPESPAATPHSMEAVPGHGSPASSAPTPVTTSPTACATSTTP